MIFRRAFMFMDHYGRKLLPNRQSLVFGIVKCMCANLLILAIYLFSAYYGEVITMTNIVPPGILHEKQNDFGKGKNDLRTKFRYRDSNPGILRERQVC